MEIQKVNLEGVKREVTWINGYLKNIVDAYGEYAMGIEEFKKNAAGKYSPEYIEKERTKRTEELIEKLTNLYDVTVAHLKTLKEEIDANKDILNLNDGELQECLALLNSGKVTGDIVIAIAERFKGHRRALELLKENTDDTTYKNLFSEGLINYEAIIQEIEESLYQVVREPNNVIGYMPKLKSQFHNLAENMGAGASAEEKNWGDYYVYICNLQMIAASGLYT